MDEHRQWLEDEIAQCHQSVIGSDATASDVVVAFLGDNCPDLLLSVLACMDLSSSSALEATQGKKLLPAMLNARWTPAEMERTLRPSSKDATKIDNQRNHHLSSNAHVTILLYGFGYERAAKEAMRLMNGDHNDFRHFAMALSLPELAEKYYSATNLNALHNSVQNVTPPNRVMNHDSGTVPNTQIEEENISGEDALILFTSGTSSPNGAKGVRLSHRSLLIQAYAKTQLPCCYDHQTNVVATTVPWFHVGGMSSALAVMLAGGCLIFPHSSEGEKGFQPGRVLQSIQPCSLLTSRMDSQSIQAANTLVVVPAMLHAIANHVQSRNGNKTSTTLNVFANVKLILVGGQSIGNGKLYKQTRQLFPKARIVQTYACTEAGSSITFQDLGWKSDGDNGKNNSNLGLDAEEIGQNNNGLEEASTCVGSPPPHIQIGIFDAKANSQLKPSLLAHGKMGIIGTRGPHTMSGYWSRNFGNTNSVNPFDPKEDWMLTNDLGYIHPQTGKLYFCGRANDVIRTGGESVLATEVERVLDNHHDIIECAVFALPDEKFGEAVCAAVVLKDESTSAAPLANCSGDVMEDEERKKQIRNYCAEHHVAGFKRPRRVFCLRALPRNSSGKVLKHAIIRICASKFSPQRSRL